MMGRSGLIRSLEILSITIFCLLRVEVDSCQDRAVLGGDGDFGFVVWFALSEWQRRESAGSK